MKKTLLILLTLVFILSGCSANTSQVSGSATPQTNTEITDGEKNGTTPAVSDEPLGRELPTAFISEADMVSVIKGEKALEHGQGNTDNVRNIKFYFISATIPKEVTLSKITVSGANIAFLYPFDMEPDPDYERTFVFEWFRPMGPGDVEKNVKRWFSENDVERYNDYMIVKVKPYDENDTREYMRQDVFWEQGGYAFHAIVPVSFTKEDIAKYCVAKKVVVNLG